MSKFVSIYCGGCRRKLGEGDGTVFELRCPNCKSITRLTVGARLERLADKIAQLAQSQPQGDLSTS